MKCSQLDDITSQLVAQYLTQNENYTICPIGFVLLELLDELGKMEKKQFVKVLLERYPALKYAYIVSYDRLLRENMIEEENGFVRMTSLGSKVLEDCKKIAPAAFRAKNRDSLLSIL